VQSGETVLVAERRAPDGGTFVESRVDRAFTRLAITGILRVAERAREPYQVSQIVSPTGTSVALLDAGREPR